ncbi:probable arabinosyltransferase ARAD1 [Malania oleifera]|uniref:probable arabinosyltransferase ARAD1 n=1 Tax=Malania oleifera TaxID=397392 RepID=UPI0025AE6B2C|nr:probable arabinosyltransferase ARAD1 [Malania oleifera]
MTETNMLPSWFLFRLITISMFVLILSSVFLIQSGNNSFIPRSVFKLIIVNNTPVNFKSNDNRKETKLPLLSSTALLVDENQAGVCQIYRCNKKTDASRQEERKTCDPNQALVRVYLYDLPPEFHFGLLGWKGMMNHTWPNVSSTSQIPSYPGGLNLQHSIEYWLTLDLLASNTPNVVRPCTAVRVMNSSQADVTFVPFFSSLSYNRHSKLHGGEKTSVNKVLQGKLVKFLMGKDEWKQLGGKNHLIVAHHPNSMLQARKKLGSAMFVLADFGRYPVEIANLEKDVIAPYRHLVRTTAKENSAPYEKRPILVYFQGALYRKDKGAIRQELFYLLKDEKDVHFSFGSVQGHGISRAGQGMGSSKFCLNIAGDTPSSNRLFDAIVSHCVPVIVSDEIELPFEDVLDYSEFCIFVKESDAVKKGFLLNYLRGIQKDKWMQMWNRLKEVVKHFEYQFPSQPGDAVDMIWEAVSRKMPSMKLKFHRMNRYHRLQLQLKSN